MDLLSWAKENGSELGAVSIDSSTESGLLLRAIHDIQPGSTVVSCSYKTMLSYLNVALSTVSTFPSDFVKSLELEDPNIIGHFFLVQQYLLGRESFWWPYIQLLPQPDQPEKLGIPALWPDGDLLFLAGTNAQPPVEKRKQMWRDEWEKGVGLLDADKREIYTYDLYQWAATIFGSRSFRASLTAPEDQIQGAKLSIEATNLVLEHVKLDRFSILLPLVDLGNHNGTNEVDWSQNSSKSAFALLNREFIPQGSEVFNYYGDKSNSELLVAYGFTLPGSQHDVVNLKVTPGPSATSLRRSQSCYLRPHPTAPEAEFMFQVRLIPDTQDGPSGLPELRPFSHGLIDTIACMVANNRETQYISAHPEFCFESGIDHFDSIMSRNFIHVLYILQEKLKSEIARIKSHESLLGIAKNRNQRMALDYRRKQLQVLVAAVEPISLRLNNLFALRALHSTSEKVSLILTTEILSLDSAYEWLCHSHPTIGLEVTRIIAEDQEEELPLDWTILVEDWDHTYWIVWVFIILLIRQGGSTLFNHHDPKIDLWIQNRQNQSGACTNLFAEPSEEETINNTIERIVQLPEFASIVHTWPDKLHWKKLRNLASYAVHEEGIRGYCKQSPEGKEQPQEVLCISKF